MATNYQSGLASLFSVAARSAKYVTHKDWANGGWNVFGLAGGREEFIQAFSTLEDAQSFCSINNGVVESVGGE